MVGAADDCGCADTALIWFVASIAAMAGADYLAFREWIATPVVSVLLVLMTIAVFHHAQLGLQVVLEDYVHSEWLKIAAIALVKFAASRLPSPYFFHRQDCSADSAAGV